VNELDTRRERAARNQSLFREINERIDELGELWANDKSGQYVCECLDTTCTELVSGLCRDEYHEIRRDPTEFVVLPGHERLEVEEVLSSAPGWLVVRTLGTGREVAERFAAEGRKRTPDDRHVG
jgi:hypothetical protein